MSSDLMADSVPCPEELFMKTECMTTKKLQINGFCAIPVILDYMTGRTTTTVLLPHTLKDLAVGPTLWNKRIHSATTLETYTCPPTLMERGRTGRCHLGVTLERPQTSSVPQLGSHQHFTAKCHQT